jgi:tetratricopeptide (TPR) repeat protein
MNIPLDNEYVFLASLYNHQDKFKESIEALQIAISENPSNDRAHFVLARTKDEYYADTDSKIKVYESFKEKFPKSVYVFLADRRLKELKEEKFMKDE